MLRARNMTSHIYDAEVAQKVAQDILGRYFQALLELSETFKKIHGQDDAL